MSYAPPPASFEPGGAAIPATKVEISVSCRNLRDRDTFSKSDPMCVLYVKEFAKDNYREYGRTEMIKDSLNPSFVEKFIIDYFFEQSQKLKFELYDVDSPSAKLTAHDFLGRMECTLGEIVGAPGNNWTKTLTGLSGNNGVITVRAEEIAICKEIVTFRFSGTKLDKKDFLGKSDPFLVISRSNEDQSFTVVHRTEVIKNTLNPEWRAFTLKMRALNNGDHHRSIKFDCYDWDSDGSHDFIGAFVTSMKELASGTKEFELVNPKKQAKKKSYKNSGRLNVLMVKVETEHTFLDFIAGGMQLNFTVAIDFTASNGDPRSPTSLHYLNQYQPNQYATALSAVGGIIQDYDSDKMFPALGFGAKLSDGRVSHEFFLNGNPQNPYCTGIDGIMAAYQTTLQSVQLYGPTNFSPVINHVAKFASAYTDGSHYFVLLILTDGVITDMQQTKAAIVAASSLPMSIIIVGVGQAEFDAMEELDADERRLSAGGRYAERDIVQFVPFRNFIGGRYGNSTEVSQAYLAKEVLAEIPEQITGYMKARGILPKPPQQAPPQAPPPSHAPPPSVPTPSYQGPPPSAPPPSYPPNQGPPPSYPPNQGPPHSYPPNQGPPHSYPPNQGPPPSYPPNQGPPPSAPPSSYPSH